MEDLEVSCWSAVSVWRPLLQWLQASHCKTARRAAQDLAVCWVLIAIHQRVQNGTAAQRSQDHDVVKCELLHVSVQDSLHMSGVVGGAHI